MEKLSGTPFYQSLLHILIMDLAKYNLLVKVSERHSPHCMLDECNFSLSEVNICGNPNAEITPAVSILMY